MFPHLDYFLYICVMEIKSNADIKNITTFGISANAACVVYYDSYDELKSVLADESLPRPFKHLGQGSNMLFTRDFHGTILISRMTELKLRQRDEYGVTVSVSAGYIMDNLCADMAKLCIWGLENLSGIPGTAGASAVQNVGAYGVEAGDLIARVDAIEVATLRERSFSHDEMEFGYRHSIFKTDAMRDRYIITRVYFNLTTKSSPRLDYANLRSLVDDDPTPGEMRCAVMTMRNSKLPDPTRIGSAGSFFKNPVITKVHFHRIEEMYPGQKVPHFIVGEERVKIPAAWLIDKAGCKPMTAGGASLWQQQPLVIVNAVPQSEAGTDNKLITGTGTCDLITGTNTTKLITGTATAGDILTLEHRIIEAVSSRFDITLSPEVEYL